MNKLLMTTVCALLLLASVALIAPAPARAAQPGGGSTSTDEVIVLAAPSVRNRYYRPAFDDLIEYNVSVVNTMRAEADVVIVVDPATYPYFEGRIPDANIIIGRVEDIWIRDFGGVTGSQNARFRYRPDYLRVRDSKFIDRSFKRFAASNGTDLNLSGLILDGGNFVGNGADRAVITERVFSDNRRLTRARVDRTIKLKTGVTEVAYLPEEPGDTTGHSDGMVMWLDEDTIVVNENIEPMRTQILNELYRAFGDDLDVVEVPIDYTPSTWRGFGSACGLHVNSLVTDTHVYMPTYGQANDSVVAGILAANTTKTIVPIDASSVCHMGGAVRCLTWLATGADAAAMRTAANA